MGIKLIIKDEVNIKLEGLPLEVRKKLAATFKYEDPTARYRPAFQLGRWDGKVSMFGLGGNGYLNQLEKILEILYNYHLDIDEIDDLRTTGKIEFEPVTENYWADQGKVWPVGHERVGQPIMLRDYQVDAINKFLENTQSLQEIATGAGKCRTYDSILSIYLDTNTKFGNFLLNKCKSNRSSIMDITTSINKIEQLIEKKCES